MSQRKKIRVIFLFFVALPFHNSSEIIPKIPTWLLIISANSLNILESFLGKHIVILYVWFVVSGLRDVFLWEGRSEWYFEPGKREIIHRQPVLGCQCLHNSCKRASLLARDYSRRRYRLPGKIQLLRRPFYWENSILSLTISCLCLLDCGTFDSWTIDKELVHRLQGLYHSCLPLLRSIARREGCAIWDKFL